MFAKIKALALAIIGAIVAIGAVFKFGQRSGKQSAKQAETERRLKSTQDMKEIKDEIEQQDDPYIVDTLNRFVRPKRR